jgi:hypothetical protein
LTMHVFLSLYSLIFPHSSLTDLHYTALHTTPQPQRTSFYSLLRALAHSSEGNLPLLLTSHPHSTNKHTYTPTLNKQTRLHTQTPTHLHTYTTTHLHTHTPTHLHTHTQTHTHTRQQSPSDRAQGMHGWTHDLDSL